MACGRLARSYHPAIMAGVERRLRLRADRNVQLAFGRDLSELGRLGHPAALDGDGSGLPTGEPEEGG